MCDSDWWIKTLVVIVLLIGSWEQKIEALLKVYLVFISLTKSRREIWPSDSLVIIKWLYLLCLFFQGSTLNMISWNMILLPPFKQVQDISLLVCCLVGQLNLWKGLTPCHSWSCIIFCACNPGSQTLPCNIYKQDLALNNLQGLICHKTKPIYSQLNIYNCFRFIQVIHWFQ